jgi:hypothetical protein
MEKQYGLDCIGYLTDVPLGSAREDVNGHAVRRREIGKSLSEGGRN